MITKVLPMKNSAAGQSPRLGRHIVVITALLLLPMLLGCGSDRLPTHAVIGAIEFEDGTHPMFGDIEFYNAQHKLNARGEIKRDGSFTVGTYVADDGAVEGKHQIIALQMGGDFFYGKRTDTIKHDHGALINSSFFDYRTSGLECDIVPGENRVKLTVRKNPRQTSDGMPKN
jgi:hypothetical protein